MTATITITPRDTDCGWRVDFEPSDIERDAGIDPFPAFVESGCPDEEEARMAATAAALNQVSEDEIAWA